MFRKWNLKILVLFNFDKWETNSYFVRLTIDLDIGLDNIFLFGIDIFLEKSSRKVSYYWYLHCLMD